MRKITLLILMLFAGLANSYAQFPAPYCTPTAFTYVEPITLVNFAGINNTSPAATTGVTHENFTTMFANVDTGGSYPITLKGNTNGNWQTFLRVYIDWNQNNVFTDAGEAYDIGTITNSTGTDAVQLTGTITVPGTALAGNTRMRVIKAYAGYADSCNSTARAFGQTEDYSVTVTIPTCVAPTAGMATVTSSTSADLSWTSTQPDGAIVVQPAGTGTPATAAGTGVDTAGATTYTASGLLAMTAYEFYVRNECTPGVFSSWAGPYAFNTTQLPGCSSNPTPVDGAVNVPIGPTTFTWDVPTTGDAPTSYDLYAGNTPTTLALVGNYPTNTTGDDLTLNGFSTLLYWQVVPKNIAGAATGCAIWSFTTEPSPGYCLDATYGQYPSAPEGYTPTTCDGVFENEVLGSWAGEYTLVNVTSGQTYQFASSIATDFITIGDATGDTSFIAGITPVTWVSTVSGQIRFYTHANDQCASNQTGRTRSIVCGVVAADAPDYANLQWPETITIVEGGSAAVFGQVYEPGLTDVAPNIDGQAPGIQAWVGISPEGENTDPATWTNWIVATHNASHVSNNDEYTATIGATLDPGTYYYATRFRLNSGAYVYGGFDSGFWNGTTEVSGVLTVQAPPAPANDDCSGAVLIAMDAATCDGTNNNGTTIGATDSGVAPADCFNYGENDVWFMFTTGPLVDTVDISTDFLGGTLLDTEIALYEGVCGSLVELDCDQDDGTTILSNGSSWNSFIEDADVNGNQTYYVRVSGYSEDNSGTFCLKVSTGTLSNKDFNNAALSVYPNPVKDILNLSYTQSISAVGIFNMLGQEVAARSINATEGQVDMSGLASGTYIVKVTAGDVTTAIKVVKE